MRKRQHRLDHERVQPRAAVRAGRLCGQTHAGIVNRFYNLDVKLKFQAKRSIACRDLSPRMVRPGRNRTNLFYTARRAESSARRAAFGGRNANLQDVGQPSATPSPAATTCVFLICDGGEVPSSEPN